MRPCDPTRVLRDEHRLILRVIDGLESILDEGPAAAASDTLAEYVTFFRLFTDACHHGKEEDLLFGALAERGFTTDSGPLGALLEEHRQGRALVGRMTNAVEAMERGDPDAPSAFSDAGREYIELLRRHIEKEDQGVFHMADGALPEPACRALCDGYANVCARKFEGRSGAELEALGERLARA